MKAFITTIIVLGLIVLGYALLRPKHTVTVTVPGVTDVSQPSDTTPSPTTTGVSGATDMVRVTTPTANQLVSSPLTVTGSARGNWYFEGSFPVELIDAQGKQLAIKPASAQGEWMTTNFVPFSVTLTFAKPTTATGTLVLHKDNPSGEAKHDAEVRIPVRFSTSEQTVKLYYYNSALDKDASGNVLCSSKGLVAVNRSIPLTQTPIQDTIKLLLQGNITAQEKSSGITSEFPLSGVSLTGASQSNGVLTLALNDPQHKTNGGACRVNVLRAQLEATAKQFPGVTSVRFSPSTVLQP